MGGRRLSLRETLGTRGFWFSFSLKIKLFGSTVAFCGILEIDCPVVDWCYSVIVPIGGEQWRIFDFSLVI